MINAVEEYPGQLFELKQKQAIIDSNRDKIEQWVTWLDSDIRMRVMSEWEKDNKRELKYLLETLL
jgi:hypothetical protein